MAPQRYQAVSRSTHCMLINPSISPSSLSIPRPSNLTLPQVSSHDNDDFQSPTSPDSPHQIPHSPPPSFRSRASSLSSRRLLAQDPLVHDPDHDLQDAFDDGEASDAENDGDDRQRLMRAEPAPAQTPTTTPQTAVERRVTELPAFRPMPSSASRPTDGVFANLSAKPERGEQLEEKPPVSSSYFPGSAPQSLTRLFRHMNKLQRMPLLRTGKPLFSLLECPPMKSTSTDFLLGRSFHLFGTA